MTVEWDAVLASLYEAAVVREKWPLALQGLAELCDSRGAVLTRGDRSRDGLLYSAGLGPTVAQYLEQGWYLDDYRTNGAQPIINGGLVADQHIIAHEDIARSDYYSGFAKPADVPWFAAGGLERHDGVALAFSLQRSARQGPFSPRDLSRMNAILPRLREVLSVAYQINTDRERALLSGLELVDQAAVLIDRRGLVKDMNRAGQALIGKLLSLHGRRLVASRPRQQTALTNWISCICACHRRISTTHQQYIRLEDSFGRIWIGQAAPVAGAAADIFSGGFSALIFTPAFASRQVSESVLIVAFGLTAGEARVARLAANGLTVDEVADRLALKRNAVRFHLKSIFLKAGVHRQSAFVAAVGALTLQ